jgi:tetratricopeptide (TPR) repeat protein
VKLAWLSVLLSKDIRVSHNLKSMGLFDLFKKKKTESTFPENELEVSLMNAASDVAAQKAFYQKLLWSQLVVLNGDPSNSKETTQAEDENMTIHLVAFDNKHVPVFTSPNRIFDKNIVKEEVSYMSIQGQALFEFAKGATFILNPYSDHWKELIPEEIENLMNGTIYDMIDKHEIEKKKYEEFNLIFERAGKRQEGLIALDGYHRKNLTSSEKLKLEESVKDFQKCLEIVPDHWQSMMLMAKALQRLERHFESLEQLEKAFKVELENHTIPMEASIEAMHLKDIGKALFYSEESLKRKPNDIALMGNYAMNLLIAEKDMEAKAIIEKALQLHPNDQINRNVESIIKDVITGRRKRPNFDDAIK